MPLVWLLCEEDHAVTGKEVVHLSIWVKDKRRIQLDFRPVVSTSLSEIQLAQCSRIESTCGQSRGCSKIRVAPPQTVCDHHPLLGKDGKIVAHADSGVYKNFSLLEDRAWTPGKPDILFLRLFVSNADPNLTVHQKLHYHEK